MDALIIAFALLFFLKAINALMAYMETPAKTSNIVNFIYCFVAAVFILHYAGLLPARL